MLLQQSIEHVSIVYTCNTYFVMPLGPCNLFWSVRSMFSAFVHVIYSGVSGQCSQCNTSKITNSISSLLLAHLS